MIVFFLFISRSENYNYKLYGVQQINADHEDMCSVDREREKKKERKRERRNGRETLQSNETERKKKPSTLSAVNFDKISW